jgi:membrane-bound ClpP family serine protease
MKILKALIIIIFVLFAILQYNDPDPYLWIPVYLYPAYLVFRSLSEKGIVEVFSFVAIVYIFWAVNVFPAEWEGVLLNEVGMKTVNIELGRESLGLGLVGLVLLALSISRK